MNLWDFTGFENRIGDLQEYSGSMSDEGSRAEINAYPAKGRPDVDCNDQ